MFLDGIYMGGTLPPIELVVASTLAYPILGGSVPNNVILPTPTRSEVLVIGNFPYNSGLFEVSSVASASVVPSLRSVDVSPKIAYQDWVVWLPHPPHDLIVLDIRG